MERLTVYETIHGNYAVRPEHWAGIWDSEGRIQDHLNHIAIFKTKEDAEWYVKMKDAEEQGLMIRLPCPIGSTVYSIVGICECDYDYQCNEEDYFKCHVGFCEHEKTVYRIIPTQFEINTIERIGKTVFLTKEEAEQALAEMERKNE